jgi:TRAP-type mannitol/chloroaromatic compound transport system permease small subunit
MKPLKPNLRPFLLLLLLPFLIAGIMFAIEDIRTTWAIFENDSENAELLKIYLTIVFSGLFGYVVGWAVGVSKGYKRGRDDNYRSK